MLHTFLVLVHAYEKYNHNLIVSLIEYLRHNWNLTSLPAILKVKLKELLSF